MTGRELVRLLEKEGWVLDRIKGSHHIMIKDNKTLSVLCMAVKLWAKDF